MSTLVVVAAVDNRFDDNVRMLDDRAGKCFLRADTSMGGHPSAAFIRAYHRYDHDAYLFLQDSLYPLVSDYIQPFAGMAEATGAGVVGWARFPLPMFDGEWQKQWVEDQYPPEVRPQWGIFGPIFYAKRKAMEDAELWFPRTPRSRLEAQGTERAWAYCFEAAHVPVAFLGDWSNDRLKNFDPIFRKTFAGRPDV